MEMPAGTVFSYYEPCVFRDLNIKASAPEAGYPDFGVSYLVGAIDSGGSSDFSGKCELMEKGQSVPMDFDSSQREGLFEDEQLFAVYEVEDVKKLITRLENALKGA